MPISVKLLNQSKPFSQASIYWANFRQNKHPKTNIIVGKMNTEIKHYSDLCEIIWVFFIEIYNCNNFWLALRWALHWSNNSLSNFSKFHFGTFPRRPDRSGSPCRIRSSLRAPSNTSTYPPSSGSRFRTRASGGRSTIRRRRGRYRPRSNSPDPRTGLPWRNLCSGCRRERSK